VPCPISGELERWSSWPGDTPERGENCPATSLSRRRVPADGYGE
jgi:hypothetical protein